MTSKPRRISSNIFSIFTSIQGEGLLVGVPQIFIRFTGCNIRCKYCDTPEALTPQASTRIEKTAFSDLPDGKAGKAGDIKLLPNPLSVETLTKAIQDLTRTFDRFHSIALTGGEPLLSNEFLQELLPRLKKIGLPIFLETNGTLPAQLNTVINLVDIVSMDIKIPSSIVPNEPAHRGLTSGSRRDTSRDTPFGTGKFKWADVAKFLKIGTKKQIYVKVVVTEEWQNGEFIKVREIIRKVNPSIPVILQPVSCSPGRPRSAAPTGARRGETQCSPSGKAQPSSRHLLEIYRILKPGLKDIRIIPQVHKLIGWA